MSEDPRYSVTIYLAAPGTPLASGGTSLTGHMYLETAHGKDRDSYGFQPAGEDARAQAAAQGSNAVPGAITDTDARSYQNPYYARTLEITQDQYERIREFGADPRQHGFDMNYQFATNSCTDFAWSALNHAGIHRQTWMGADKSYEGELKVLFNQPEIQNIQPPVPGSDLNRETHNAMPERDVWQRILSENETPASPGRAVAAATPADPAHPEHALLTQLNGKVAQLDAANGRSFDATSERISASLLSLAKENNFARVDHVLLSERTPDADAARNIFIVQGAQNDPAHVRAAMLTEVAAQTPVETSFARVEQLAQAQQPATHAHTQALQDTQRQEQEQQQHAAHRMA